MSAPPVTLRRRALLARAVAAAALVVFLPAVGFDFVSYDDWKLVRDNPWLAEGLTSRAITRAFAEPYYLNWIPLTTLSYHLDAALFGLDPRAFHATNVGLHALASALLFLALVRLTGAAAASLWVAAVFAVHPLVVEPVAWVSSRKDVLSGACFAAALWAHARWALAPSLSRYLALLAAVCAGLMAKPMLVTLPFVLLLLDAWPLRRLRTASGALAWPVLWEKLPLLLPALGIAALTLAVQPVVDAGEGHSYPVRLVNAVDSLGAYLRAAFWPSGLAAFYPHPGARIPGVRLLLAAFALVAVSLAAAHGARRRPALGVGWLWFLGMLIPVLGLTEVGLQARADRYVYLPLIGLAGMVAALGCELADRGARWRRAVWGAGFVALLVLAALSRIQLGHWRDSEALYRRAIAVTRDNYVAHYGLAGALAGRGDLDGARAELAAAIRARPDWTLAYERWAQLELHRGDRAAAREVYRRLLALRPRDAAIHAGLADLALADGDAAEAARHWEQAMRLRPGWLEPVHRLAWLRATHPQASLRDPELARTLAERVAAESQVRDPTWLDTLAAALAAGGEFERALELSLEAEQRLREAGALERAERVAARSDAYRAGRAIVDAEPARPRPPLADPGDAPLR